MNRKGFISSFLPLGIVTVILFFSLLALYRNLGDTFQQIDQNYKEGSSVVLHQDVDRKVLQDVIFNNGYAKDSADAAFIANNLTVKLQEYGQYPSLYALQKRKFGKVSVTLADSCHVLKEAVMVSKDILGQNDSLFEYYNGSVVNGGGTIVVVVREVDSLNPRKSHPCPQVPVRLRMHYRDSLYEVQEKTLGAVLTDASGKAVFTNLDENYSYSVLPIKAGYEYGSERGTTSGKFSSERKWYQIGKDKHTLTYSFEQKEHLIPLFDNLTLRQIKSDHTITVRTPTEYKNVVTKCFIGVLIGWWILSMVFVFRKKRFDTVLIAAAMFLTGLCVLMMFAIQNPLTEELRGVDMTKGVLMGLVVVFFLQFVDFVKFYQNRYKLDFDMVMAAINWLFLPFKRKVAWLAPVMSGDHSWWKKTGVLILLLICLPFGLMNLLQLDKLSDKVESFCKKLPKGFGWLLLAILLTAMLWTPFGQSIGGMKVNLKLGPLTFQPSEIAKYLILFFMAAFFTQNADTIIEYSRPARTKRMNKIWNKVKILGWIIGGLLVLMALYLLLGDMGPALVIGVTFVLMYSLVKSKVNLENLTEEDKWSRIFTCDFAMLIYGVVSFAAFMAVGAAINKSLVLVFALLWFVAWIGFGLLRHRQFFETAFILNMLVFIFVFGGQIMQGMPMLKNTDLAERFDARTRMCVNTWGDWAEADGNTYENAKRAAVSNTQVANGLWALATGGMNGQGLGKGNPNLIPAFHTDMILSSIGEEVGWIGLLVVVLALALLLRRMIVVGYKAGHPFAFYFCSGVAIVTGVQFFIIALGSSGMIPLTGITVPFLSYGRVSMILNLIAFGVVLSLSQYIKEEQTDKVENLVRQRSVGDYNYPVAIVSWTFVVLALFTLNVWQYYSLWNRNKTLVHTTFVYNRQGIPLIEYNPRIALLTNEMWAGNIYDRNDVLLATSDKSRIKASDYQAYGIDKASIENMLKTHQKRYYPFAEHLFFMLGDMNNGLYFTYNEDNPIGFMAEAQYLSYLRDFDNVMRDKTGNVVKVTLLGKPKGRFLEGSIDTVRNLVVRDYHELIPYLKDGVHGSLLKRHNEKVSKGKYDLKMTLDAKLQTEMQERINAYVESNSKMKNNNLLRISVVVLDAENGDLLTSSNYPLPDYQRLREEEEAARQIGKSYAVYSDNFKRENWIAYTDRDLGLTNQTQPGSTAKVMSAMAGFMKVGPEAVNKSYVVNTKERVDVVLNEPTGIVSLKRAIVESSNCYFVNSVNDMNLYTQLGEIYKATGVRIDREIIDENGQTIVDRSLTPYFFYAKDISDTAVFNAEVFATSQRGRSIYNNYIRQRSKTQQYKKMNWSQCAWAWGQGTLRATPLNMARVASIVVNNGSLAQTRYLFNEPLQNTVVCTTSLEPLKSYMKEQANNNKILSSSIGGKTGTPERSHVRWNNKGAKVVESKNDAWYIFFVDSEGVNQTKARKLAVAVRIERANATSGLAMQLTRDLIIPVLTENEYIR